MVNCGSYAIDNGIDVVWLLSEGESCLICNDSKKGRDWAFWVWARILKSLYWIWWWHELLCILMALCSFLFNGKPVRWLTPLWESMRTFNIRLLQPTYVPKLHFGQLNSYTKQERINSGRVSLKWNNFPIVNGFLKINLKSTYGYRVLRIDNNSCLKSFELLM